MRWNAAILPFAGLLALLPPSAGCYQSTGLRILNFFGLEKQPVVLALVAESRGPGAPQLLEVVNPFLPYEPLQQELTKVIGRPVALELCFPLQLEPNLHNGMYDMAIVSAAQYGRFRPSDAPPVLAVAMDVADQPTRAAVLVVKSESPIQKIDELRGQQVAFGAAEDSRTQYAALELLARHGVKKSDLKLEMLPLPGSLQNHADAGAVAEAVLKGGAGAGFIDEAAWDALRDGAGTENDATRSGLRVIGRTIEVPDRLVVASPSLDEEAQKSIRGFLYLAKDRAPHVLKSLRCAGYAQVNDRMIEACRQIVQESGAGGEAAGSAADSP